MSSSFIFRRSTLQSRYLEVSCFRFCSSQSVHQTNQSIKQFKISTNSKDFVSRQQSPHQKPHTNHTNMTQSKADKIEEVRQNLPIPQMPPKASDWQSADASKTNVGSGRLSSDVSTGLGSTAGLREPATKASEDIDMSGIGRQGKDGLSEPPKDARSK
ncbi:Putative protein of unknown function [Podospora comata]|uniref:Uncharacterized protein n=1 Tax=Podospora comata TaxID=48703 RepID=A0ABY6S450_PODCO|nr:Putative protein of unknown function [Podospora comata]